MFMGESLWNCQNRKQLNSRKLAIFYMLILKQFFLFKTEFCFKRENFHSWIFLLGITFLSGCKVSATVHSFCNGSNDLLKSCHMSCPITELPIFMSWVWPDREIIHIMLAVAQKNVSLTSSQHLKVKILYENMIMKLMKVAQINHNLIMNVPR